MHTNSWTAVDNYIKEQLPIYVGKTTDLWSYLSSDFNTWEEELPKDAAMVYFAILPTMGVVPQQKLDWLADFLTDKLSSRPLNSVAVILHTNRCGDEVKHEKKNVKDLSCTACASITIASNCM